jgi:hypothetical protein
MMLKEVVKCRGSQEMFNDSAAARTSTTRLPRSISITKRVTL